MLQHDLFLFHTPFLSIARKRAHTSESGKCALFLFVWIPVKSFADNMPCRFVDETHLEVGNNLYHICEFAEQAQRSGIQVIPLRQSLPEKCFSTLEATGEIIVITKGEKGYTPTGQYPQDGASPKEAAAVLNDAAKVTREQEAAMVAGSMFGWDTPAADPKNYDTKGVPIKNHRERDAR